MISGDAPAIGRPPRRIRILGVALMLVWLTQDGCSWLFVKGPPPPCSTWRVAPWIDTGVAAFSALGAVSAATHEGDDLGGSALVAVVLFIPLAVVYGISAIWGHRTVSRCRAAPEPAPTP